MSSSRQDGSRSTIETASWSTTGINGSSPRLTPPVGPTSGTGSVTGAERSPVLIPARASTLFPLHPRLPTSQGQHRDITTQCPRMSRNVRDMSGTHLAPRSPRRGRVACVVCISRTPTVESVRGGSSTSPTRRSSRESPHDATFSLPRLRSARQSGTAMFSLSESDREAIRRDEAGTPRALSIAGMAEAERRGPCLSITLYLVPASAAAQPSRGRSHRADRPTSGPRVGAREHHGLVLSVQHASRSMGQGARPRGHVDPTIRAHVRG